MNSTELLKYSLSIEKSSLVLKNAQMINVYSGEIELCDIAIHDGIIVGIGSYEGIHEIDMKGLYVAPGFIDAHVHIESSMLSPERFAELIIPKGTTTIIADPHEIANVSGIRGIQYMLNSSHQIPLSVYIMVPSSVPAMASEKNGSSITVTDIEHLKHHPRILGLGEVMDYPSVIRGDSDTHLKIKSMKGHVIDGHAPDIMGKDLNAYIMSGIMTDHECTHVESLIERVRRGMYVHLREGSATRNTEVLLKAVNKNNLSRLMFCTDDKHPLDILNEGHINYNVNLAIKQGIHVVDAIKMATLNPATCYHLDDIGGIAPGKRADLIIFRSLFQIDPIMVIKNGHLVAENGHSLFHPKPLQDPSVMNTIHLDVARISLDLKVASNPVRVIELVKHNITTKQKNANVKIEHGKFVYSEQADVLKIASIERHHGTGLIGLGLVSGFGIKSCSIAMTISHDSHNIVAIGTDDHDMRIAIQRIHELQGGIVISSKGKVVVELALEIGGLLTSQDAIYVANRIQEMKDVLIHQGLNPEIDDPLITLSFLCLPVIPQLKLTAQGLFDVDQLKWVPIEI